ncbi:DUF881 domain-containing protein [Streptomyces sp. ACA25]|nr:DUF881 domain-containing protein [Streptomyces sp. ACA25]MDB1089382.1 DUF881 domain-containing protein [Streptomyces sp. ACA25]
MSDRTPGGKPEETPHGKLDRGAGEIPHSGPETEPDGRAADRPAQRSVTGSAGEPGAAVPGAAQSPPVTGRAALLSGLWPPRVSRAQLIVALLLFVLGLGLAIQVRAAGEDGALRGARPEDLVRILSDLDERTSRLDAEKSRLEEQRTELETSSDQAEEARRQTRERERQLGVLAGTVGAVGPGIEIRISDPFGAVGADMLLDAVQELRAAGAEAMQINGVRIVASTSFVDTGSAVSIDGKRVDAPFRIAAIGRAQDLEPALSIPGGVVQSLEKEQATVSIERPEEVTVDALRSPERPDYAQSSS